jgi:3-oxoacyl-[acyl-carrier-protein] synthase-3
MTARVRISGIAAALPDEQVTSAEVEDRVRAVSAPRTLITGSVASVSGVQTRRYAAPGVNASDLAVAAARRVLDQTGTSATDIDLLIFASASQDMLEPATAHVVQDKLGTTAAVMDIKNACNSFLNGIQVGEALIQSGQYRRVLITGGEIPSRSIKWQLRDFADLRQSFLGYTLGDAGVAALLEPAADGSGIFYRKFLSVSKHWPICTIPGGGSAHPRDPAYTYMQGDGLVLKEAFREVGPAPVHAALAETGLGFDDFARILVHQVSLPSLRDLLALIGVPDEKVTITVADFGNMASASLPVAFDLAARCGEIRRGDRVMLLGLAAGISVGIIMFEY